MSTSAETTPHAAISARASGTPRGRPLTGLGPHLVTMTALAALVLVPARTVAGLEGAPAVHAGALFAAGLSASLVLHELAHAAVATACGHPLRSIQLDRFGGRVLFPQTITAPVLLIGTLPPVVTAAAGVYGVLVLHQTVSAARHR